jgi:hypothetical protein
VPLSITGYADSFQEFHFAYVKADRTPDPEGFEELVRKGWLVRVDAGTKVHVVAIGMTQYALPLHPDSRGVRDVKILDGKHNGQVVSIPARLLRPVAPNREK